MRRPLLLPVPRKMRLTDGRFAITEKTRICLMPGCGDPELEAALELADAFRRYALSNVVVDRVCGSRIPRRGIGLRLDPRLRGEREAYSLRIGSERAEIVAQSSAGLFYGVQTLIQLVLQYERRLPALRVEDTPDFRYRGFMLDVSRGRVPRLDYLKSLVHMLSHFKINMLQLYVEHTFHFRSHPEIGEGCSPLEPDEILELDRYCRSRHVELVPSLQSFGHMGHILSLPKFRHLAEVPQFDDWEKASWHQRQRGMMITPVDRGAYRLLADLYNDFLPLFSSRLFNMNSDETWDLGKGRSAKVAKRIGVGRLYLRHIARIAEMARGHGRTPMIWADVIYEHPDLIAEVPDDLILLDWVYSHDSPFGRCARLAELGRQFFVCPGTSGWDQVFNDVWNATRNIRRFVAAGKQNGAIGVLNTDWGDCGHFNMPACSFHGGVLGAAMSWHEGQPTDDKTFDRAFSLHVFDDKRGVMGQAIRRAGSVIRQQVGKRLDTWPLWASPLRDCQVGQVIPPRAARAVADAPHDAADVFMNCSAALDRDPLSCLELATGAWMLVSLGVRAELEHKKLGLKSRRRKDKWSYREWAEDFAKFVLEQYEEFWNARSKPSNLCDVVRVFQRQIRSARQMGRRRKRS